MVLTKSELVASLQNEVRILLHLASKIDRAKLDYRPTPNQRSTIELLQYLTVIRCAAQFRSVPLFALPMLRRSRDCPRATRVIQRLRSH